MRIIGIFLGLLLLANICFAGQIIERHDFYSLYDPTSSAFVYDDAGDTATGDQVAVNTYTKSSIQITGVLVGEYIEVRVEGRLKDQTNAPTWAVLDNIGFGASSSDTSINQVIEVTEYVDFLRVGMRQIGTNGTSRIDIRGIFTNLER